MKRPASARALASLERIARRFGNGVAGRKLALLAALAGRRLHRASQLRRFHEVLCFLHAYPDDRRVRARVRRLLDGFHRRRDLARLRGALAGSGIAGTDTPYRFFWPTARWISETWPGALTIDRDDPGAIDALLKALPQIVERAQAEWLKSLPAIKPEALDRLVPHGTTDADFVIARVAALPGDEFTREAYFDRLDPPFVLAAGRGRPERTTACMGGMARQFQAADFPARRPSLREAAARAPVGVRALAGRRAQELIRAARFAMIARERDLEVFEYPNAADAFLVDDGAGLAFAMLGIRRERRATLPATFAGLMVQNGVPIGYVQLDVLGRHAGLSFNLFESFRGSGAARLFARYVAVTHHVFGCDWFSVEPYQLGLGNDEGIESGAWWFYYGMGFRPHDASARRLAAREAARRKARPAHRSSRTTLRALSRSHLFFSLDATDPARLPRTETWLAAAVAESRQQSSAVREASRRLRLDSRRLGRDERAMLGRWATLVLALTAESGLGAGERRALKRLLVAKAGRSERDYQRLLLRLPRLRRLLGC